MKRSCSILQFSAQANGHFLPVPRSHIFIQLFIICCCIFPPPASAALAADGIPQTTEEIHEYAQVVMRDEILRYCSAEYTGTSIPHLSSEDLADAVKHYPAYPRRITDSANTTITIIRPLKNIVAVNSMPLGVLDAGDCITSVSSVVPEGATLAPWLAEKTDVGGGQNGPDFEKILSLHPDAILTYTQFGQGREFYEDRLPDGVPVIRLDFIRPSTLATEMKKLGYLLNRTDRSSAYVSWHDGIINEINRRLDTIPQGEKARVFIDVWSNTFTGTGNERRTVSDSMYYSRSYCSDNGGINIAADLQNPQGTVDIEWIAQQDPEIILGSAYHGGYAAENSGDLKSQYDELSGLPALKEVQAVKNKRIYILSFRYVMGLSYPAARAQAVQWIYPDLFADMNPDAIHQEYVDMFYNVSYDVTRNGAFHYP
ncbi:MAG: Periplasmic binding protein [Methanoregula sp. PtaU1.Bin051]|nr:MAG: Periplasmic binding protein [Methanoregula sp. PtaU1.Bin051]